MKNLSPRKVALILSGGGARGAYEVGVLSYIFGDLARLRGGAPKVDILSGTSVGAINACFMAAHLMDPVLGVRRLVDLWTTIEISKVLGFNLRHALSLPRMLLGGGEGTGIFDAKPMTELLQKEISWRSISRCLRRGHLQALSVSTTEVATGRTVVFMHTSPHLTIPSLAPPRTLFRAARIGPEHALASGAIPLIFPPVKIDDHLYLDGGLRQNTPIAPALRLGATHIFAIGSSREVRGPVVNEGTPTSLKAPGLPFLLGKVLNAFLLDHIDHDMELLERLNQVIVDGTDAFGPGFGASVNEQAMQRGAPGYRYVSALSVHPSEDIGRLANDHLKRGRLQGDPLLTKRLFSLLDLGIDNEADLASYLLFDGPFCRKLIELGRADAHAKRDQILEFFGNAEDDPESDLQEPGGATGDSGFWEHTSNIPFGT